MTRDDLPSSPQPAPHGIELAPGVYVSPPAAMRIKYARSSGPGGQNVNKVNSKAELWLPVGAIQGMTAAAVSRLRASAGSRLTIADEIHLSGEESRSQEGNRMLILDRLRELIICAQAEPKVRRKTKRSRGSQQRRLHSKKRRGEIKSLRSNRAPE